MKVLVVYFSQSGNTEKIARAVWEEATLGNGAELKKLEEVEPGEAAGFDLVFVGSPLHSADLAVPVKDWLTEVRAGVDQRMAGFITHFAPAYPDQDMDRFTEPIKAACAEKGIEYRGCFDCQGALTEALHEPVQQKLGLSDEEWAKMVVQMTGRPNQEDVAAAKAWALEILG